MAPLPSVSRLERALEECRSRHPRQPETCEHLASSLGWAAIREACPGEVDALEGCCRREPSASPPPKIPERCQRQVERLEECLVLTQEALEDESRSRDRVSARLARIKEAAARERGD